MGILVTGGAGYIGSHVSHMLCDAGEDVYVLDNLVTGFKSAVPATAKFINGDVGEATLLRRIFRQVDIEAVMHFAASVVVPESLSNPMKYYKNNTANSAVLIKECLQAGISNFIFSSTAAVYGTASSEPSSETTPLDPMSPYASSKLMVEQMLKDASYTGQFNYIALRYFNVAGADPQGRVGQSTAEATHLIKVACQTALGQRPHLDVYGDDYQTPDGTCIRDYIHVSDLAEIHVLALEHLKERQTSGIYNCGYGKGASVFEVIKAVEKASGLSKLPVKIVDRREGDPVAIVADSTLLKKKLDWTPKYDDLNTIVSSALAWEKQCLKSEAS